MRPTLGFCSIAFREERIEDIVPRLAAIGYDAVELWYNHVENRTDEELRHLGAIADQAGIELLVISPYLWLTQNEELLAQSMEIVERCAHIAGILGIRKFRTFTDSGPTGIGSAAATPEIRAQAVRALKDITAANPSLRFVVETHCLTLADNPHSMSRLLDEVGADNLKVLFQPLAPDTMMEEYQLLQDHIEHVHLHNTGIDGKPGWIDEGDCDFPELFAALKQNGYQQSMSVEYCFKGATWERAKQALAYLKHFW